jgi:C1A family cysteine protease
MSNSGADDVTLPEFSGEFSDNLKVRAGSDVEFPTAEPGLASLPDAFTLIEELPCPFYEPEAATCTAQAVAGCYAHLHRKRFGQWMALSRLHLYEQARRFFGATPPCEEKGAWLGAAIQMLAKNGACREELWPFNIDDQCGSPSSACLKDAPNHRLQQYWNIDSQYPVSLSADPRTRSESRDNQKALENLIISCLVSGYPVVFAIKLYMNFKPGPPDDRIPWPDDKFWMWHAMLLYGYDRNIRMYKVQNSWGVWWGHEGKCRIPMDWINGYGQDFYAMRAPE